LLSIAHESEFKFLFILYDLYCIQNKLKLSGVWWLTSNSYLTNSTGWTRGEQWGGITDLYEEWPPRFPQKCENVGHVGGGAEHVGRGAGHVGCVSGGQDAWAEGAGHVGCFIFAQIWWDLVMIVQSFRNFGNSWWWLAQSSPKVWSRNFLC